MSWVDQVEKLQGSRWQLSQPLFLLLQTNQKTILTRVALGDEFTNFVPHLPNIDLFGRDAWRKDERCSLMDTISWRKERKHFFSVEIIVGFLFECTSWQHFLRDSKDCKILNQVQLRIVLSLELSEVVRVHTAVSLAQFQVDVLGKQRHLLLPFSFFWWLLETVSTFQPIMVSLFIDPFHPSLKFFHL